MTIHCRKLICLICPMLFFLAGCHRAELPPILHQDQVRQIKNVRYFEGPDADDQRHLLDVYLPSQGDNWPAAMVVHGGAWVVNDKSVVANMGYALADAGLAVTCCNYRLFPHAHHPAQVTDVARALAWTKKNLPSYGADTSKLILIGYSSGATLAALIALEPDYLHEQSMEPGDLSGVVAISGIYELQAVPLPFRLAFTHRPSVWEANSPLNLVKPTSFPWLIMHAENDLRLEDYFSIKEQSNAFHRALLQAGARATLHEIADCNHDEIEEQVGREPESETFSRLLTFIQQAVAE